MTDFAAYDVMVETNGSTHIVRVMAASDALDLDVARSEPERVALKDSPKGSKVVWVRKVKRKRIRSDSAEGAKSGDALNRRLPGSFESGKRR